MKKVPVYVKAEGEPSDPDDESIPGIYLVEVDADLPVQQHASAALDVFHAKTGIGMLEDFSFSVFDAHGRPMEEPVDADSYKLTAHGAFSGKVENSDDLPEALRSPKSSP